MAVLHLLPEVVTRRMGPLVQSLGSEGAEVDKTSYPPFPLGQAEWEGVLHTGKQEFSCHWTPSKLCSSVHPHLPTGASRLVWTWRLWLVTLGELDSRARNWLQPFFFHFSWFHLVPGGGGTSKEQRSHRYTAHTETSTWQGWSISTQAHNT